MRSNIVVAGETGFTGQYTNLRHDARGASFLLPHQQLGALTLPTEPADGDTVTLDINGNNIVLTAKTTLGTTAGEVLIGGSAAAFAANVLALLNQPQTTTATGVALSTADQQLLSYLSWSLTGTTITPSSNNTSLYAPLSSFSASTTTGGNAWTAQAMQLYVEPGVVYVNGMRVIWSGGSSPTITAPSSHPRIDLLTIDNTGTLAVTTGTEASSPSTPTYPADKVVLCEIYNVVGETGIYDNENQQSGQGYVYHDVRPVLGLQFNPAAIPDSLLPSADGTLNLGSGTYEWNNGYFKNALYVGGVAITGVLDFFGDGSDGNVTISSGTTTLSRDMFYQSLTIDSGATLNTNNYRVFVRGTLTNNGTITGNTGGSASGVTGGTAASAGTLITSAGSNGATGGSGGANETGGSAGTTGQGANKTAAIGNAAGNNSNTAGNGGSGTYGGGGSGASSTGGSVTAPVYNPVHLLNNLLNMTEFVPGAYPARILGMGGAAPGGGGGGGGGGWDSVHGSTGGSGGQGGGSGAEGGMIWIAAGVFAGSGTVQSLGGNGSNGANGTAGQAGGGTSYSGGGGGGAGGNGGCGGVFILVTSSKTFTGTVTLTGGSGGSGGSGGTAGGSGATAGATGGAGQTGTSGIELDFIV